MKTRYSEEADEAIGPMDTAADACVREHKLASVPVGSDVIAAIVVIGLLLLAMLAASSRQADLDRYAGARPPAAQWQGTGQFPNSRPDRESGVEVDDLVPSFARPLMDDTADREAPWGSGRGTPGA
jgi:hypothetical protein